MTSDIKRFIFTGTPGSGKTSVIQELTKQGHTTIHEAATDIIALEQSNGIARPWEQPDFIAKIIHMQRQRQLAATGALQFYDRSPFCTYALGQYLANLQETTFIPPNELLAEIERCLQENIYQKKGFFFENLGFVEHTAARQISYEEALAFEKIHLDVYKKFGFEIALVPKELSITQRVAFILDNL